MTAKPLVFVVDDDESVRRTLRRWIESRGWQVMTVVSAEEFLDAYVHGQPGCVVFDVRTPGPSGSALHARLAARSVDIPLILVTGCEDASSTEGSVPAGCMDVVTKPCTEELLLRRIEQALERDAARRSHPAGVTSRKPPVD